MFPDLQWVPTMAHVNVELQSTHVAQHLCTHQAQYAAKFSSA